MYVKVTDETIITLAIDGTKIVTFFDDMPGWLISCDAQTAHAFHLIGVGSWIRIVLVPLTLISWLCASHLVLFFSMCLIVCLINSRANHHNSYLLVFSSWPMWNSIFRFLTNIPALSHSSIIPSRSGPPLSTGIHSLCRQETVIHLANTLSLNHPLLFRFVLFMQLLYVSTPRSRELYIGCN